MTLQQLPNVEIKANVENLELYSDNYPFRLSLRIKNFENETLFKKFAKNCELMLRKSVEYKIWRNYIIDVLQINSCVLTHEVMGEVTLDIHHHIPSLYGLVVALINEKIENQQEFCTFEICQSAINLHYQNKVGYVVLISSLHEKFHNGYLDIPIEYVKGDYMSFINQYMRYLDEEDQDTIRKRLTIKETNCSWSRNNYPGRIASVGGK